MNGAHWHLVLNHLPIIFPIVGVKVMITGLISKSEDIKSTSFLTINKLANLYGEPFSENKTSVSIDEICKTIEQNCNEVSDKLK